MKKSFISLAVLSLALSSQPGSSADLAIAVSAAPAQIAVAATQEPRLSPPATRPAAMQLAAIGDSRDAGGVGSLREAPRGTTEAATGGLPSTPIALASLLLMICILIGRRN